MCVCTVGTTLMERQCTEFTLGWHRSHGCHDVPLLALGYLSWEHARAGDGLTHLAASFLGSELEFDLTLYVLPTWGNLVSLWIGHIFPFLLASSQSNYRHCL